MSSRMTLGVENWRPIRSTCSPKGSRCAKLRIYALRTFQIGARDYVYALLVARTMVGVVTLLSSRSVEVDADSDLVEIHLEVRLFQLLPNVADLVDPNLHLVRVAEGRAEVDLHAIVEADLLTDERPLKLHHVLRLLAEAERDLRIRAARQVRAREELHLRLEARDAGQQPLAAELGLRVEVAVAHVVRLKHDLSADLVRRLLTGQLLDEQPRVRARLNVEAALHQIVVHAKLDVVAVRLRLLAQLQHRVRRSLHVDREVQRPGPVSAQPIVSLRGGADQVVHG